MPGYITLMKFTQQGASRMNDLQQRIADTKATAEKMGGRTIGVWLTFGEYDLVAVGDWPDDITLAAYIGTMTRGGGVTTLTMRAFSEDEMGEIARRIPAAAESGGQPSS